MTGKVYLIGAGPGDPGLITLKGIECIQKAEVVVYDYLAPPVLLKYASKEAQRIYVGKKGGDHTLSQDGINALLVEKAKEGFTVARLKGGDPFIFGRGGEEAESLKTAGILFEVVPGVTSAIAAPAYAGIPLTHREYTSTVAFVTGHEDPTKQTSSIEWEALAKGVGTIVFLMGVKNLPNITIKLKKSGMSADTPVAVVRWGTTSFQKTVIGTLDTIVDLAKEANMKAPAIIVVGQVVTLRDSLEWFESRPLLGKQIVVTRAREQASDLVSRLSDLGAACLEIPTIKVMAPKDWKPLDKAIESLSAYDWLVFTSVNGVKFFFKRLFENGFDVRRLHHIKTACIGPVTSKKLRDFGINTDILPESYRAESVVDAFENVALEGKKVLLPRAKEARSVLPDELTKMGAQVDEITAYRTEAEKQGADQLLNHLKSGAIDLVTFTSSSTVKNFKALLPEKNADSLMENVTLASIGPITTDTARSLGFHVQITADTYTIPGLCDAIIRHYASG